MDEFDTLGCEKVSFDSLIKSPKLFHDKCIELEGYLNHNFENVAIYKLRNRDRGAGAVWLNIVDTLGMKLDEAFPNGVTEKIIVKGMFNSEEFGHLDGYVGEIRRVTCIIIK